MPGVDSTTPPAEASRSRASPQARGRCGDEGGAEGVEGRIPAHAESTVTHDATGRVMGEDPRARGVNVSVIESAKRGP